MRPYRPFLMFSVEKKNIINYLGKLLLANVSGKKIHKTFDCNLYVTVVWDMCREKWYITRKIKQKTWVKRRKGVVLLLIKIVNTYFVIQFQGYTILTLKSFDILQGLHLGHLWQIVIIDKNGYLPLAIRNMYMCITEPFSIYWALKIIARITF